MSSSPLVPSTVEHYRLSTNKADAVIYPQARATSALTIQNTLTARSTAKKIPP